MPAINTLILLEEYPILTIYNVYYLTPVRYGKGVLCFYDGIPEYIMPFSGCMASEHAYIP